MSAVVERGSMLQIRDNNLIFHACVPCDAEGNFLSLEVDGKPYAGKALFEQLHKVVWRAFKQRTQADLDMLWYLWCGPRSPLFGKDKMTTFESYFVADKAAHKEHNNSYFSLLHNKEFCERVLAEWGLSGASGLIVNGHVPVKIAQGESPVKKSGLAVTIDGAFSEAYGDHGYTLVLESTRTFIAQHHRFESVQNAIDHGHDIIPTVQALKTFDEPRRVGDTEEGDAIRQRIALLELLITAYEEHTLAERRS
jgi:fructose-1,6-bisphosphatase-3